MTEEPKIPTLTGGPTLTPERLAAFQALEAKHSVSQPVEPEDVEDVADEGAPDESNTQGRDEGGRFKAKDDRAAPEGDDTEDGGVDRSVAQDAEYEAAFKALRRWGYTPEEIESMGAAAVKKRGASAIKQQADTDRLFERQRQLEEAQQAKSQAEEGASDAAATASGTSPSMDWEANMRTLGDALGESDAEALGGILRQIHGAHSQEVQALQSQLAQAMGFIGDLVEVNARRDLEAQGFEVSDDEKWQAVRAKVSSLNAAQYTSLGEAYRDAAILALGGQSGAESSRRTSELDRQKEAGSTRSTARRAQPKTQSPEDVKYAEFRALEKKHGVA